MAAKNAISAALKQVRTISSGIALIFAASSVTSSLAAGPVDDLAPGCWYEAPNSQLEAVFPNPRPPGVSGPSAVMDAWSGGAFDTRRNRLLVWGGGHTDYAGNEIYTFDVSRLKWSRLTEPTPNAQIVQSADRYADKRPSSRHSYNTIQYVPGVDQLGGDRLFSLGFHAAYGAQGLAAEGNAVDAYNFGTKRWEIKANKPDDGNLSGAFSAYDPVSRKLYHHGLSSSAKLSAYDLVLKKWEIFPGTYDAEPYMTAAIDPLLNIMVATGGENRQVAVWNLTIPGSPMIQKTFGDDKTLQGANAPGFVYDPASDRFVGWRGGTSVYTLDPSTWIWNKVEPAPSSKVIPTAPSARGTYGRFRYIPSKDAFVLVTDERKRLLLQAAKGRWLAVVRMPNKIG